MCNRELDCLVNIGLLTRVIGSGARFSKVPVTTGPVNLTGQLPGLVYVPEVVFLEAHVNLPLSSGSVKIS